MSDLVFWIWWLDQLIMFSCWLDWFRLCLGLGNR